jgi:hypothetical protein
MVSLAWLLLNRLAMSDKEKTDARDPYKHQIIVENVNRFVVNRLGGIKEAVHAEKLLRNDIDSIWDDRVLNRAYEVFGGVPEVKLVDVGESVPQDLIEALAGMVARIPTSQ